MKIKTRMIGMDLDGTLLKSDKELTQYTGVPKELLEFPGIRYAVTANGGKVIDLEKNEAIVEELLPHDIAEVMLQSLHRHWVIQSRYRAHWTHRTYGRQTARKKTVPV